MSPDEAVRVVSDLDAETLREIFALRPDLRQRLWAVTHKPWAPDHPVHPGVTLRAVLRDQGMTQADLAARMGRPFQTINEIVVGKKRITGPTALDLGAALGISPDFWMGLQADFDLASERARRSAR